MNHQIEFTPVFHIMELPEHLFITFDSMSPLDLTRAVRGFRIGKDFEHLTFVLEGFDKESRTDDGDRFVLGKILLVVNGSSNKQQGKYELAECKFLLPPERRRNNGVRVEDIAYSIRQGVSNAFISAISSYRNNQGQFSRDEANIEPSALRSKPSLNTVAAKSLGSEERNYRRKMALAIAAPMLVCFFAWCGFKIFARSPTPVEAAVSNAMKQDPNSVAAQIELTKATLRQMGLDPGKSGDLGCLAPQK